MEKGSKEKGDLTKRRLALIAAAMTVFVIAVSTVSGMVADLAKPPVASSK